MMYYGIYKITNLLNGKMYIGKHKTSNIDDGYMGSGKYLKRSIQKYGKENFRKEWLMFCEDEEEMNYMERVYVDQTWLDRSDTYNLKLGGEGGGAIPSEETRKKMSDAKKGRKLSSDTKKKLSESHKTQIPWIKGKHHTNEIRKHLSDANKGKHTHALGTHWWNNGIITIHNKECPAGFVKGRLKLKVKES